MGFPIIQVDAFTRSAFAGNPAAVCVLRAPGSESWMRDVAREMTLAETAFLHPEGDGYLLRWFTPVVEDDLCGHATLASAHVLWEEGHLAPGKQASFQTRSGLLTANRSGGWIELDFPTTPAVPVLAPTELTAALGVTPRWVGRRKFEYLLEFDSESAVLCVRSECTRLLVLEDDWRSLID